jgi:peptidoglycan/LPS O-acetylase OafA/YrhL
MSGQVPSAVRSRRTEDNPWLDLLRALAIVLVLLRHGYVTSHPDEHGNGLFDYIALNGWIGVDLFFVLSGYLISRHLMRAGIGTPDFSFARYMALRALRIVPAYVAVIALIVLGAFPLYRVEPEALPFRIAYHLLFLQDYLPANLNVAFWSLGVEEKFYLLAPLLLWLVAIQKTLPRRLAVLAAFFLLPIGLRGVVFLAQGSAFDYPAFFRALRSPFHASLDPLVAGVAIAALERTGALRIPPRAAALLLAGSALALLAWLSSHEFLASISLFDAVPQPALIALVCALMVVAATGLRGRRLPFDPPVRTVARLSYSLYLVHLPLLPASRALAAATGNEALAFWPIFLSLSFAAAAIIYAGIERPFLQLKSSIARRPARIAAAPAPLAL